MSFAAKTISVVIATYNGSKFIEEQLNSVINQTFQPIEIIVSDDISNDNTIEIVNCVSASCDLPIKILINERRLGFRDNFLTASRSAIGEFIAFCDQDDIWDRRKLEKASEYFDDRRVSMIVHAVTSFDHLSGKTRRFSQGIRRTSVRPPLSYDPWLTFFGFSIIFRCELLALANPQERFKDFIVPSERIAHDRWIMFLGQMVGATVELSDPLVRYRQHPANLFGDGSRRKKTLSGEALYVFDDYISSTLDMIKIVERLPGETSEHFPLFDRNKSIHFLNKALNQLRERREVYEAQNRLKALLNFLRNVRTGIYQSVHNKSLRWRSIAKDLKQVALRM